MAKNRGSLTLVSAGLVAGLTLGSIGLANASASPLATSQPLTSRAGVGGADARQPQDEAEPTSTRRRGVDPLAGVVAGLTGTNVADVMAARRAGKSFSRIAEANGVTADQVLAVATKRATADIAAAVRAGRLSPSDGQQITIGLRSRLMRQVVETATRSASGRHRANAQ